MFFPFHDDNPTTRVPLVTLALIGINVVTFVYMQGLEPLGQRIVHAERGFVPARMRQLRDPDRKVEVVLDRQTVHFARGPFVEPKEIIQIHALSPDRQRIFASLFTAMFLHGGWLHLLGNMWFLWLFGNNVEDEIGHVLYFLLYFAGGLLAWASHWAVLPEARAAQPVIGASGAVAAVLGAYAVRFPRANVRCLIFIIIFFTIVELPAVVVLGIWFVGQLIDGIADLPRFSGGVAWWAHIGGFLAGMVMMPIFSAIGPRPEPHFDRRLGGGGGTP
jgi:membrane associated rhomboid family serine protease